MSSQQLTSEETPQALPEKHRDVLAFVEAALFAAEEPLTPARISRIIDMPGIGEGTVSGAIQHLKAKFTHGITLNEADGAYYFGTTKESGRVVSKVLLGSRRSRSSRALLETLAIIAYNQPATKSDVEAIRGVDSTSPVKRLLEKGLIAIAGRRESAGKPFLYTTTRKFLQTFGINNIGELPIPGDESEVFAEDEE